MKVMPFIVFLIVFQSPVTEASAMTRKVIRTMQFNLSRSSRSKHGWLVSFFKNFVMQGLLCKYINNIVSYIQSDIYV